MSRTIAIENVSDALYELLRKRAEQEGMSIPNYLLSGRGIDRPADPLSVEKLHEILKGLPAIDLGATAAELIREDREERDEQIWRAMTRH